MNGLAPRSRYRGYELKPQHGQLHGEHILWRMFPNLPKSFVWNSSDKAGVRAYIDALYAETSFAAHAEHEGLVTGIEHVDPAKVQVTDIIPVNVHRLFDTLQLADTFNIPLWGRVRFVTNDKTLVPATFIEALVSAHPERFGHLDPTANWHAATDADLRKMNLRPDQVTSGMYRDRYVKPAQNRPQRTAVRQPAPLHEPEPEADDSTPTAPPRERTMRRRDKGEYADWLTETVPDEGPRWYTRRVYAHTGRILYIATSWQPHGPWTVWERDSSALLSMGIDL